MEAPASPGTNPVDMKDCIEELLKFTLDSHNKGALEFDLGLSTDFCSRFLKDCQCHTDVADGFNKVLRYPLYKCLASSLYESIASRSFSGIGNQMASFKENDLFLDKQKKDEESKKKQRWLDLILERGYEIVNILKSINFELQVQEPFFTLLKDGHKTIEGRCATDNYNRIESRSYILFNKCVVHEVQEIHHYASFHKMLESEGMEKVLPGVKTIDEGVQIYRNFYTEEKEMSNGVLAISVAKSPSQPYVLLGKILSGLSYGGVQSLLGLAQTAGTISDGLPPPRSSLLSSFMLPYNPKVKGSALTTGARALMKHTERSSDKYWGDICGNDSDKNRLAMEIISRLLSNCCWMNVHIVPPHGVVFEIRIASGYGARWSKDGNKFIGFLEPYMDEGHSKGWKH